MTVVDFISRFAIVFALWIALHIYAYRRLVRPARFRPGVKRALALAFAFAAVAAPSTFAFERFHADASWRLSATYAGFVAMGLSASLLVLLIARDAMLVIAFPIRKLFGGGRKPRRPAAAASVTGPAAPTSPPSDLPSRRAFFLRATDAGITATALAGFGIGLDGGRDEPHLVEIDVPLDDLAPELDGFRIAQLSDVHIGPIHDGAYLARAVDRVNALGADLVAVTGDLVDGDVADLRDAVSSLGRLKARHGAWFVTGNHEFYWDAAAWCAELRRIGLRVLENEHVVIEHDGARMTVAGVHDLSGGKIDPTRETDPHAAFSGSPEDSFRLLLAHQPKSIYRGAAAGARLQLSGHTHGGQFFPFTVLIRFFQPFVAGLYEYRSAATGARAALFVHRGTGSWGPPLRLGSRKEIVLLTLRRRA